MAAEVVVTAAGTFSQVMVPPGKITEYLLDITSAEGKSKAKFFMMVGFSPDAPQEFSNALIEHCKTATLTKTTIIKHGIKYTVAGEIQTPKKGMVYIQSIWMLRNGTDTLRLTTAYPRRQPK